MTGRYRAGAPRRLTGDRTPVNTASRVVCIGRRGGPRDRGWWAVVRASEIRFAEAGQMKTVGP